MPGVSAKRKKAAPVVDADNEDVGDCRGSSSDEELLEKNEKEVQVDFEAREIGESDLGGISQLLKQLHLPVSISLPEISQLCLSQCKVGSVLKQSVDSDDEDNETEDEAVYGVCTVLNLSWYENKKVPCIQKVVQFLKSKDPGLSEVLSCAENRVGWIVNERFLNLPPSIGPPTWKSLEDDLAACEGDSCFECTHFLLLAKTLKPRTANVINPKGKGKHPAVQEIFPQPEEEFFAKHQMLSAAWEVSAPGSERQSSQRSSAGMDDSSDDEEDDQVEEDFVSFRKAIIIPQAKLKLVLEDTRKAFPSPATNMIVDD